MLLHSGLEDFEGAGIAVEAGAGAEGERPVLWLVAEGEVEDGGDAEGFDPFAEHVDDGAVVGRLLDVGEVPEGDPRGAVERAGEVELGEMAVDVVDRVADVLDEDDGAAGLEREGRAARRGEEREIAADERALGDAAGKGDGRRPVRPAW